jgi:hypothetical protein
MTRAKLEDMTIDQLVDRFAEMCLDQDRALLYSELAKFNRQFEQMELVKAELKRRPGDQRRALLVLYEHPNTQVRLKAAKATLAVVPEAARLLIEDIANSRKFPQAGEAGMTLVNLDRGVFKPV